MANALADLMSFFGTHVLAIERGCAFRSDNATFAVAKRHGRRFFASAHVKIELFLVRSMAVGRIQMGEQPTTLLSQEAFLATLVDPMANVTARANPLVDIWPYVDQIPEGDLKGFVIEHGLVELVYRTGDDRFDHVLIPTLTKNVYLVIVVLRTEPKVFGHHLLNLNEQYGLPTGAG